MYKVLSNLLGQRPLRHSVLMTHTWTCIYRYECEFFNLGKVRRVAIEWIPGSMVQNTQW